MAEAMISKRKYKSINRCRKNRPGNSIWIWEWEELPFFPKMTARPPKCRRTIMIAVDGSEHSKYAVKWSLDNIVRQDGTDWVLLVTCKSGDVKGGKGWAEEAADEPPAQITSPKDEVENAVRSIECIWSGEDVDREMLGHIEMLPDFSLIPLLIKHELTDYLIGI